MLLFNKLIHALVRHTITKKETNFIKGGQQANFDDENTFILNRGNSHGHPPPFDEQ